MCVKLTLTNDFYHNVRSTCCKIVSVVEHRPMNRSTMNFHPNYSTSNDLVVTFRTSVSNLRSITYNNINKSSLRKIRYSTTSTINKIPVTVVMPSGSNNADFGRPLLSSSQVDAILDCNLILSSNCCKICRRRYSLIMFTSSFDQDLERFNNCSAL